MSRTSLDHERATAALHERGPASYLEDYTELARSVEVEGDVVECGVYNGSSLAAIARGLPGRHCWAYDSFQGFPEGSAEDDEVARGLEGSVVGDPAEVTAALYGLCSELTIRKGWFQDTFEQPLPERIAFLSIDCDLYESVTDVLNRLVPLVVPGGIVTLDDWGCFIGCRRAFYDWIAYESAAPLLRTFGPIQAWWRVGEGE